MPRLGKIAAPLLAGLVFWLIFWSVGWRGDFVSHEVPGVDRDTPREPNDRLNLPSDDSHLLPADAEEEQPVPSASLPLGKSETLAAIEDLLNPKSLSKLHRDISAHNRRILEGVVDCASKGSCKKYQSKSEYINNSP